MFNSIRNKRTGLKLNKDLIILMTIFGAVGLVKVFGINIPCIFYKLTGLYCPGCGITRSLLALIKFDLYQAFRYNIIIYIITPVMVVQEIIRHRENKKLADLIIWACLILCAAFMILRNIQMFEFLAPTAIR